MGQNLSLDGTYSRILDTYCQNQRSRAFLSYRGHADIDDDESVGITGLFSKSALKIENPQKFMFVALLPTTIILTQNGCNSDALHLKIPRNHNK